MLARQGYDLPQRRLISQEDTSIVQDAIVPRSRFLNAWGRKMTFDAGYLVPFMWDEVLPGDHLKYDIEAYVRMATPLFPMFDNQRVDTFLFYVPYRILWTNWVKLMGEQNSPGDSIAYTVPQIQQFGGVAVGTIYDHMGIPDSVQVSGGAPFFHSALPLRAYNAIYNQWFRDQNIINAAPTHTGDAADPAGDYVLRRRAKSHDYFTSALPWPQKFTAPNVPLGGFAPIVGLGAVSATGNIGPVGVTETNGTPASYDFYKNIWDAGAVNQMQVRMSGSAGGSYPMVYADLSLATGVAINTLRQAWLIQSLLERDARGGTRYTELIWSHWKVRNPDFRLQRPEYIGGGQSPLILTPIAQTAPTAGAPVGALGAAGTSNGRHTGSYAATEHGIILGLINIRSELSYYQGMHKMWTRATRYDFPFPSLMGLGEQAILRREIYMTGNAVNDALVFGYQERWHEYRTRYSEVTGMFRGGIPGTLNAWHLAQHFGTAPVLNQAFIEDTPAMDRVLAAGALAVNQQYLADIHIQRNAVRPISLHGTPSQLGNF